MNKGLQISLLVGLFAISTAAGYFISSRIFPKEVKEAVQEVKPVVEEPVKSPVPVIDSIASSWSDALKEYTLTVYASVETNEQLKWCLYEDASHHTEVKRANGYYYNEDGKIQIGVPGTADGNYYFKIVNNETRARENEASCTFTDCKKPEEKPKEVKRPLTKSQVQDKINNTSDGAVPDGWSAYFAPTQTVKVLNGGDYWFGAFADIWTEKYQGFINSVQVVELYYNDYNKVYQMDINVY